MANDTCKALWVAGFRAILPDGTELVPGETVVTMPRAEAEASDHWRPVGSRKPKTTPADGGAGEEE